MTSARDVLELATPHAEARFVDLQRMDFAALAALPETHVQELQGYAKHAVLTTYRAILPTGDVQVVVQLAVSGALGTARFWAEGFRLSSHGTSVRLKDEDLYGFH